MNIQVGDLLKYDDKEYHTVNDGIAIVVDVRLDANKTGFLYDLYWLSGLQIAEGISHNYKEWQLNDKRWRKLS